MYHDNWQYLGRKTIEKILEALNIELTELFKVQKATDDFVLRQEATDDLVSIHPSGTQPKVLPQKDFRPIRRVSLQVQNRFDELAEKNTEGTLTPSEQEEYEQLVDTLEKLTIENAERLSRLSDAR